MSVSYFKSQPFGDCQSRLPDSWFGTESMPALPLFLAPAAVLAAAIIAGQCSRR